MVRKIIAVVAITAVLVVTGTAAFRSYRDPFKAAEDPSVAAVQAKPAQSFVDRFGMGIHAWWPLRPWSENVSALTDLNVHYVREDLAYSYNDALQGAAVSATIFNKWAELKNHNISVLGIANETIVSPADVVNYIKHTSETGGALTSIDGPNEVEHQCNNPALAADNPNQGQVFTGTIWVQCPDDVWRPRTETYITNLWNAIKNDPATRNVKINSPSLDPLQANGSTAFHRYSDYGNIHYYPYLLNTVTYSLQQALASAATVYPGEPMVITEVGYGSKPVPGGRAVNEALQAKILPTYLLEAYKQNVARTYLYSLYDDTRGNDFNGLIEETTGRRKPAFDAIKRLTDLLKDSTPFTPSTLRYQLSGDTSDVSSLLFQKSNGHFYLILWQSKYANSPTPLPTDPPTAKAIDIKFGQSITQATKLSVVGRAPVSTDSPTSVPIQLTDEPLVIDVKPVTATSNNTTTQSKNTTNSKKTNKTSSTTSVTSPTPTALTPTADSSNDAPDFILPAASNHPELTFWQKLARFFGGVYRGFIGLFVKIPQ